MSVAPPVSTLYIALQDRLTPTDPNLVVVAACKKYFVGIQDGGQNLMERQYFGKRQKTWKQARTSQQSTRGVQK